LLAFDNLDEQQFLNLLNPADFKFSMESFVIRNIR
jgi:hypothetical protein